MEGRDGGREGWMEGWMDGMEWVLAAALKDPRGCDRTGQDGTGQDFSYSKGDPATATSVKKGNRVTI